METSPFSSYSPQFRESLDKNYLRLIGICEKSRNLVIEDLKAEFKHITKSIDGVEGTQPSREY